MVAQERRQHAAFRQQVEGGLQPGDEVLSIGAAAQDGLDDEALRLGGREEEEAVHGGLPVLRQGALAYPGLTHHIGAGLGSLAHGLDLVQGGDVFLYVRGVEGGHRIQAESVHIHVRQPEGDDVLQLRQHSLVVQVQIGHAAAGELLLVMPVGAGDLHIFVARGCLGEAVIVQVRAVQLALLNGLHRRQEPGVPRGGVIHRQVDDDPDTPLMAFLHQRAEVIHRAILGIDGLVVRHVVLMVGRGGHDGHEPDAGVAHVGDVIQTLAHAVEIADAVAVGILIGVDEDLVPVVGVAQLAGFRGAPGRDQAAEEEQENQESLHGDRFFLC